MANSKYEELLNMGYRATNGAGAAFSKGADGTVYVNEYVKGSQKKQTVFQPTPVDEDDSSPWKASDRDSQSGQKSTYEKLLDMAYEATGGQGAAFQHDDDGNVYIREYSRDDDLLRQTAKEAAEAEAKRKKEAEGYKKKGVLGRIWDVIRGIDDRAGQAFLANASGLAASVAGKDTAVSDVQAAAKLIADKDDGVSVGQALKRLDQQLGNRAVAGAAGVADRIWNEIGGVINRFGGNVDTENDIFSRWNQNRQAIKAASTEALYGPDGVQGNAVSDWNERRVAIQQRREEMYQNRYSESPVAQAVSKYGTMVWSQAPSAMLAVMMTVANPAAGIGTIANGLAPATTKGLGYIAALENSSGMKKLAMLAGNTVGNLAKDPQFWYSYSQEAGGAYNEAIQEGADPSTASLYASVYGALSGAIEIQGVFEGGNLEKLPGNIKKALMSGDKGKAAWMYVESILGEIGEEEAQDMVSKLLKTTYRDDIPLYSTTDENAVINPRSMLETAKDTAITTALMGAGERAIMGTAQKVSDSRTYRGDAALLFEQAKQAGGEKNAEAIAKIEKAATNAGGTTKLNMGQARELYQIIRDNGGEEAYNEAAKTKNRQQIVGASIDSAFEGTNLDAKGRETLINDFTPGETKLYDYTQGVKEAYSLGQQNRTLEQATKEAKKGSTLTEEQFRHAWQLGRSEVSSQSETVDPKTEEGKTRLTSELKVMGEHAEEAAAVYNADQDVKTFATAMNTAANLYAAQGEKVKEFVSDVRAGKAASEIGYLTDEQLATAYQIGAALQQERQAAVKASAARFKTIRAQAQQITAQATSAAQIDKAITETRAYIQNETKQADELKAQADELISADEVPENAEEIWNRATAEEKEHRKNAERAQETLKELETKRKEIPATESAKTRGRATLASEGGRLTSNGGKQAEYEAVDASKLSKQQKTIVEAVDIIAQELGLDVLIVKGYGGWGGAYIGGGRILLNIYSGMNMKGFSKAIAASSFTHEMTHWLQEYASEEYDELKQYIRDSMGSEKYDALVKQEQEAGLTYEDAENEVVANACQPMLQNSKAFEQFAREHRSVAEKIRDFLKEFLDKIKAAFAEVDFQDDIPIYNAVKAVENELEGMQEIFDRALVRARENLQAERTVSNQTENRQETVSEQTEKSNSQMQSFDYTDFPADAYYTDSRIYSYDFLTAQEPMTVPEMPELAQLQTDGKVDREKAVNAGLQNLAANGEKNGDLYQIENSYTKRKISAGISSLRHSLSGNNVATLRTNARLDAIAGELIKNAIPINGLTKENAQAKGTYAMIALANSGNATFAVVITVDQFENVESFEAFDVTHAINGRIKREDWSSNTDQPFGDNSYRLTQSSTKNIAEVLEIVNGTHRSILSQDVLDHFGEARPANGYYTGRALFQAWDDMTEDEQHAEINATMTMEQAKKMIQKAFVAGEIRNWYDEYRNGEEWLRGQGASDVAEVIENDSQLYMQYIGRNPHLADYDFTMEEVIEAYLAGTLTGPVKAKAKRVDVTTGRGFTDSRFYSNTQGGPATVKTWDLANSRATKSNQAAVNKARKDILLAAHNGDLARELGITDAELNKKLRSWSRYSAKARDASIRINAGVAPENRWTGIQNSSILAHIDITDDDIRSLVKSITGESEQYQRNYIGATMLALDTHINWSGLDFEFKRGNADPTDPKVLGYYTNDTRRIVVGGRGDMNTVAHEMGHALDYLWERELFAGKSSQPLTENTFDIEKIPDEDGRTFYKNFRTFMDNLMESGAIHSSYWMEQKETFARFVARFVEWAQEIAGSSYVRGEGLKFGDKFTTAQYLEFAKLLQEKAAWDSKRAAETGVQFQSWSMEEYEEYTKDFDEDGAFAAKREQQEEKRNIDAQIRERKPEEGPWIDRVVKGEATPEQYEEWLKESGLDKLYERQREAEKHVEMLERRNRELVDSRLESEERAAIEKSGLTEAEYFRKEAVKEFGYTPYFYDAGYILPNGKMLNFSGIKGKHTGRRAQDHRAIGTIFATTKGSEGMYRFVNDGNIRIMAEAPGLDISAEHEPTPEQYRQIKSFVRESRDEGYFAVDFTDAAGRNTGSMEYDEDSRISADRIVRDIKYYYQTGEVPETQRYQFQSWDVKEASPALAGMLQSIEEDGKDYQFQRWDMTEGDTAAESNGRNLAYTRLQSENKILKDTVKALNKLTGKQSTTIEKLQERLRLNKTPEVREDDAKKMARSLLREYGSKTDSEAVARQLKEIGDYILQTPTEQVSEEEIKSRARAVAAEIIDAASEQISVDGEYMAEIVGSIRGKKLTIDDVFLGELDQAGGFEAFRRRNFGKFTLAKRSGSYDASQYMSVSQFYTDLQNNYGKNYFPDAANEGEEIIRIADAFDLARPMEVNPFEQYMGEAVEDLANRIAMDTMGGILRAEPAKYADVEYRKEKSRNEELNERIKKLEAENTLTHEEAGRLWNQVSDLTRKLDLAETQYAALQKAAEARLEQVRAEGRERETEIKAREREKAARDMKALKDYYRRKAKSQKEMRENAARSTKYRAEIERKVKKLRDMLVTNSDKLHVPEVLKAPLADFLAGIDMSSKSLLNYDIATEKDRKFHTSFGRLLNALSGQQEYFSGTGEVQADMGGYIDISSDNLEWLRRMTEVVAGWMDTGETYTINRMNTQQLHDLSNLLTNLTQAIQNLNNFMANERYATVGEAARRDIDRMEELGRASEGENSRLYTATAWENGTPYYIFKRLGEGAKSIFDGLTRGWEKMAFNVQEVIQFTEGLYSTKEVNEWKSAQHEITLEDGHKITMTTAQIMELSMLLEREQALKHIEHGGIRVGDIKTRKGRKHDTRHYHLTAGDISKITGLLTERQHFVAKALRNYMAQKGSEWGNEVSLRRFGYKFYTEGEGYYPIKTDANDRPMADTDAQVNSMFRLLNLSSSKTLNPRASNALIVGDIFETFSDHMADMAKLNGLGLPLLDAIKYFNYKERVDRGDGTYDTVTVQGAMEQAFGSAAQRYYRTLIKDINGVTENGDRGTAIYNKFMSNYKAAAVAANLRVAFLQPTSYVRASFLIKPQYLAGVLPSKAAYAEARKWSGTVNWKEIGGVDTNLARGMRDQIERDGGWKEKLVEKSMILAELGDKITWSRLWTACKRQTKAENRNLSGDELNRATADLFREVIYSTQVMDSTLTRSELMRGRSNATKAMTAFMAEPTLSYNLLFDSIFEAHYEVRRNGKGAWVNHSSKIRKAFAVYACSAAWSAVVESVFDAMRDDDDYESFMQKWAQAMFGKDGKWLTGNLAQDLTVLGKLPFLKNFISTLQGYKSGDMSITAFNTAVDAARVWMETLRLNLNFLPEPVQKAANFFGIEALDKPTKVTYYGNMTTWGKIYKTLQALSQLSGIAVANLTRDTTALWNTAMTLAGNEGKKIKTYDPGQQKSVKNAFLSGAMSEEEAIEKLVETGEAKNQDAAYWTVRGWDGEDKYSEIKAAAFTGDSETFKAEMQQANEHGIKEKEVYSSIKSLIKKVYMGEELEEGDLKIVGDATLTDEQARRMLRSYGGLSVDDAVKTVNGWKETRTFLQQHGGEYEQYGLTVTQAQYYYSTVKGSAQLQDYAEQVEKYGMDRVKAYYGADGWGKTGLTIAQYDTYYTKAAACKGTDANGDGKTDSGSVKVQVLQVINSLPVSNAVKDALYFKNNWSERTINEAPWRH